MSISCQEVFGPVVGLYPCQDIDVAIRAVDDSDYFSSVPGAAKPRAD